MKINKNDENHYYWRDHCEAWTLLDSEKGIIKEELMPPYTEELLHFHNETIQVFYILNGEATFIIDNLKFRILPNECLQIQKNQTHKICNNSPNELRFLVISLPGNKGDRTNL